MIFLTGMAFKIKDNFYGLGHLKLPGGGILNSGCPMLLKGSQCSPFIGLN
jgi:hypothetical protein